jgi:hypothetical protein
MMEDVEGEDELFDMRNLAREFEDVASELSLSEGSLSDREAEEVLRDDTARYENADGPWDTHCPGCRGRWHPVPTSRAKSSDAMGVALIFGRV